MNFTTIIESLSYHINASSCTFTPFKLYIDLTSPIIHLKGSIFLILYMQWQLFRAHMIRLWNDDAADTAKFATFFINIFFTFIKVLS